MNDIRKTRDDDFAQDDYNKHIKVCKAKFEEIKEISEQYVDKTNLDNLHTEKPKNSFSIPQTEEISQEQTDFINTNSKLDLLEMEFFKDVEKEKNSITQTEVFDIFSDNNSNYDTKIFTINTPNVEALRFSIDEPNPVVSKTDFFNPVRPYVTNLDKESDTEEFTYEEQANKKNLTLTEVDM